MLDKFKLGIIKSKFLTRSEIDRANSLPRDAVNPPSLGDFKSRLDVSF